MKKWLIINTNYMKKSVLYLFIIMVMMSLSSCDKNWFSRLTGAWEVRYTDLGNVHTNHPDFQQFYFYSNGRGEQCFYDDYHRWVSVGFDWLDLDPDDAVRIIYDNGERTVFYFRFYHEYLEFSTDPYFSTYIGMIPMD